MSFILNNLIRFSALLNGRNLPKISSVFLEEMARIALIVLALCLSYVLTIPIEDFKGISINTGLH